MNVASRIEALTRERGVPALVSGETLAAAAHGLSGALRARLQRAEAALLRGRGKPVELWVGA